MSLQEVLLNNNLIPAKKIIVSECQIINPPVNGNDAINLDYFNTHGGGPGSGNMTYTGTLTTPGTHYYTASSSGISATVSALTETPVLFDFAGKRVQNISGLTTNGGGIVNIVGSPQTTIASTQDIFISPNRNCIISAPLNLDMTGSGIVLAPTVISTDNSNKVATTAFVNSVISGGGGTGNMTFAGLSAVGNHCFATNVPGTNYGPSVLNEDASTFNFGSKGLVANTLTSTTSLGLNAPIDVNLNATNLNTSCPINVGAPGVANTKISDTQVKVRNGATPLAYSNMNISEIEITDGFDSSKLTNDKLYNNANSATTGSIIAIANDYLVGDITINNISARSTNITLSATGDINNNANNVNTTTSGDINLIATNLTVNAIQADFNITPISTTSSTTANSFIKIGGTSAEVLLADGTTAPYNSGGSGGNYFLYQSSTDITVPPSISQHVQYNNSVQPSATIVWINHITDDGIDIDFYLAQVGIGDILYFQDRNNSTNWIKYAVTSRTIFVNNYVQYGVTYVNSEGTGSTNFPNNHPIFFTSYVDSATINTRLNALETKTQYQSTPTLNQTNFAGTVLVDTIKTVTGTSTQYLMGNGSTSALTSISTSGVGTSLVKIGTSPGFELNSLLASTGLSSSLAGDTITLVNSSPASGISLATSGSGATLINSNTNPNFSLKSLAVGTGLSIGTTTDTITLTNTQTASTLANAGAGTSLVVSGTAPSLSVKSLSSGTGITLNDASSNIQIVNSSPASGISLSNAGTGTSLLSSTTNPTFTTKSLTAGTNVTFTSTANDITINASGGGGGTYTFTNGGAGTTLVSTASTATDFKPVSITAGTNVTITNSGTDILIASAGALGTNTINAVSIPTSASTYYPTFISSAVNTTISSINMDSGGLTYVPTTNTLTAGAMNSITFTSSTAIPSIGFVGASTSASKIQTTGIPTNASPFYITFVPTSTSANSETLGKDAGLSYIPTDNKLMTDVFEGITFNGTGLISTISFVGTATNATQIQTTGNPSSASTFYIAFVANSASANNEVVYKDSGLTYQPSTDTVGCGIVNATTFNSSTPVASAGFVGTCSQALQLATTLQTVTASIYYPIFAPLATSSTGQAMSLDAGLSFQPSTNTLTASFFAGALSGNATTATAVVGTGTNNLLVQSGTNVTTLLSNGTAGQFLQSNGASLPTWVTNSVLGLQVSFGGLGSVSGYLAPNRWADPSATVLTTGVSTKYKMPFAGNLVAFSSSVTTANANTTLSIVKNGSVTLTLTNVAGASTNYATTTSTAFVAGDILEIFTGVQTCGVCLFTLYFS